MFIILIHCCPLSFVILCFNRIGDNCHHHHPCTRHYFDNFIILIIPLGLMPLLSRVPGKVGGLQAGKIEPRWQQWATASASSAMIIIISTIVMLESQVRGDLVEQQPCDGHHWQDSQPPLQSFHEAGFWRKHQNHLRLKKQSMQTFLLFWFMVLPPFQKTFSAIHSLTGWLVFYLFFLASNFS